jgi:hypothetical protein
MSRAHRYLFVLVTWGVLIALYHASFGLPRLGSDKCSASGTLSSRPLKSLSEGHSDSHSKSLSETGRTRLPTKALEPLKSDSRFISWLSGRVPVDRVPFITIGDCQYIHALRNFRNRLEQWGYGDDLVVICLDQCCADARDYHAYTRYIGESVAFVKVRIL